MFLLAGFEELSFVHTRPASRNTASPRAERRGLGQPFEKLEVRWRGLVAGINGHVGCSAPRNPAGGVSMFSSQPMRTGLTRLRFSLEELYQCPREQNQQPGYS